MGLTVYWSLLAENKLQDIFWYYSLKVNPKFAKEFTQNIFEAPKVLINNPLIGQKEGLLQKRAQEFRYLIHNNYKIIYWINISESRIEILNVFDCRQNPSKIL